MNNEPHKDLTPEDYEISIRCYAKALGFMLQAFEGVVIHIPEAEASTTGKFVAWSDDVNASIKITEIGPDDPLFYAVDGELVWVDPHSIDIDALPEPEEFTNVPMSFAELMDSIKNINS